ncbi:MAG TPA: hypothetical protein VGM81_05635 [Burkholderiaceae bacterium]|jgi:sugar/nucleoside kinase (ribokinase family)
MSEPASIAVLGEALIDVFPDAQVVGGAPFNVARNLAALVRRWDLATSLHRASEFAASVCTFRGAMDASMQAYARARAAWNE